MFAAQLAETEAWLAQQPSFRVLALDYGEVVADPAAGVAGDRRVARRRPRPRGDGGCRRSAAAPPARAVNAQVDAARRDPASSRHVGRLPQARARPLHAAAAPVGALRSGRSRRGRRSRPGAGCASSRPKARRSASGTGRRSRRSACGCSRSGASTPGDDLLAERIARAVARRARRSAGGRHRCGAARELRGRRAAGTGRRSLRGRAGRALLDGGHGRAPRAGGRRAAPRDRRTRRARTPRRLRPRGARACPVHQGPLWGDPPKDPIAIRERARSYRVDVGAGQKTGFYLDQRDARDLVQALAPGRRVLDLFAYTGGFAVAAAHGGAQSITVVESSVEAIETAGAPSRAVGGRDPADASRATTPSASRAVSTGPWDLIDRRSAAARAPLGRRGSRASRAYKDLLLWALQRAAPDALRAGFSCSHHVGPDLFRKIAFGASLDAERPVQVLRELGAPSRSPGGARSSRGSLPERVCCCAHERGGAAATSRAGARLRRCARRRAAARACGGALRRRRARRGRCARSRRSTGRGARCRALAVLDAMRACTRGRRWSVPWRGSRRRRQPTVRWSFARRRCDARRSARVVTTARIAGHLAKTRFARPTVLRAAGRFLAARWSARARAGRRSAARSPRYAQLLREHRRRARRRGAAVVRPRTRTRLPHRRDRRARRRGASSRSATRRRCRVRGSRPTRSRSRSPRRRRPTAASGRPPATSRRASRRRSTRSPRCAASTPRAFRDGVAKAASVLLEDPRC